MAFNVIYISTNDSKAVQEAHSIWENFGYVWAVGPTYPPNQWVKIDLFSLFVSVVNKVQTTKHTTTLSDRSILISSLVKNLLPTPSDPYENVLVLL